MLTEILIILALIILNGILSASEIAIVSSRKARLQAESDKKNPAAKIALALKESPNNFLSTVQIGITLIGILTGFFSGGSIAVYLRQIFEKISFLASYSEQLSVLIVVFIITFFSLVLGELVPKRIGMAIPEKYAMIIAYPMNLLSKVVRPFVWLLSVSTDFIVKLFNIKTTQNSVTEEEIKALVDEGVDSGAIEGIEHDIVDRLLNLGDKKAINLMTHRSNIAFLDLEDSFEEHRQVIMNTEHTMYPVCEGSLDNVKGVVHVKALLSQYLKEKPIDLYQLIEPIKFVNEYSSAYSILKTLRSSHIHQAIVIDEYGSPQGVITLRDILSDLVGNLSEDQSSDKPHIRYREDGSYIADGQYQLDEFLEKFEIGLSETDEEEINNITTLGGLVFLLLDHVPIEGEKVNYKNLEFEVLDMDGNRIDKILFRKKGDG
ncbi:hemolysin family protein [Sphingobacterium sp. SRCM116780]|uniref:hemolysin family protein n=1 Tax=Sphingobacterium sp. SRCM116780 TaxID=2907623 RepID=UPI001F32BE08|nr:hemolysin family protein [Sphingobacterium sp. SRCM116780]UIR56726.1 hemolysin family protein [Sphingobacterium sp. SRCM116780]